MKIVKAVLLTVLSVITIKAETINFICEPAEYVYLNKFFAQGSMVVENYNLESEGILSNTKAIMSFRLAKAGHDTVFQDFVGYMIEGETKFVSSMTKAPFIFSQFMLHEQDAHFDIKFLFDYSEKFDSRIRDVVTGYVYRANCRITK